MSHGSHRRRQCYQRCSAWLGAVAGSTRVGYTGWVPGGAIPGTQPRARGGSQIPAKRAPEAQGGWSGWVSGSRTSLGDGGRGRSWTTLRARSVPPGALPVQDLADCPPTAKGARFSSIFSKVSQNDEVSPKKHEKASHSPCFQNGPPKSPLEIPRFPFWPAFSPKELMGLF